MLRRATTYVGTILVGMGFLIFVGALSAPGSFPVAHSWYGWIDVVAGIFCFWMGSRAVRDPDLGNNAFRAVLLATFLFAVWLVGLWNRVSPGVQWVNLIASIAFLGVGITLSHRRNRRILYQIELKERLEAEHRRHKGAA